MIKCNYGRSFKTENIEAVWESKEIENKILTLERNSQELKFKS
jgi:hypothetical protein